MNESTFASELESWYKTAHRILPWRETHDPYAIWLSEIMLQQTQVATVIDYYHRFLKRYPSIQSLAQAVPDELMKMWEGLGYYARCRNLQKAAQMIVKDHGGEFPKTLVEAEALPGIGKSTAGAILTFSYGQRHPLLDGNVKRVLSRILDLDQDVALPASIQRLWIASAELLSESHDPYSYNQAIMELGATLCLPKNPRCLVCPVQSFCAARAKGTQNERPVKTPKKKVPHYTIAVGVIWHDNHILIQQRPETGLLAGLWEFPGGKQENDETLERTVQREIQEELGIEIAVGDKIAVVKHAYTHFKITLHAYHCVYVSGTPQSNASQGWRWVLPSELNQYAFPKANKAFLEKIVPAIHQDENIIQSASLISTP